MTYFARSLKAVAVAIAMAGMATGGQAQTADATKAATALVDVLVPPAQAKADLDRQLAQMRSGAGMRAMMAAEPQLKAKVAENSPATKAAISRMGAIQADAVGPIMREMQASSRSEQIKAFATQFTAAELNEITAFYRSPAGAKFLARQGAVGAAIAKANQQKFAGRIQAAEKAAAPKINAELQKLLPAPAKK